MIQTSISYNLISSSIETPLGTMTAIADPKALYFLDFTARKDYHQKIQFLKKKMNITVTSGTNDIIELIRQELAKYFAGTLHSFTTPFSLLGSEFQNIAWNTLNQIPYGTTISYKEQALMIGNKRAIRAVAKANSNNTLAIIVPCHRIISSSGKMCGYASGIDRKQWLINHEKQN